MRYLLATNVVSELVRTRADEQVVAWLRGLRTQQIYLSVLTIGEIRTGVQRLPPAMPHGQPHSRRGCSVLKRRTGTGSSP